MRISRPKVFVRFSTLMFAICYLVVFTDVVFIALDKITPQTKTVTDTSFPCAYHDCNCKTAEQCRTHCCCFPKSPKPTVCSFHQKHHEQNVGVTIAVSYLSAAKCVGNFPDDSIINKNIDQYIPSDVSSMKPLHAIGIFPIFEETIPTSVFKDHPDKIPIQSIVSIS